jgi:hypothetical protein
MANYRWLRRMHRWEDRRFSRRVLVTFWIALLAFWVRIGVRVIRVDALSGIGPTVLGLLIIWWAFRMMRIRFSLPPMAEQAVMEYGKEFDALTESQQVRLFRDQVRGRMNKDEREAELQLRAEGTAYRLLRPGLMLVVAGYWAVCLLGPFEAIRETLALTAIAFTWLVVMVLLLPTILRMWTQLDEVGEPKVGAMERET